MRAKCSCYFYQGVASPSASFSKSKLICILQFFISTVNLEMSRLDTAKKLGPWSRVQTRKTIFSKNFSTNCPNVVIDICIDALFNSVEMLPCGNMIYYVILFYASVYL